MTADDWPAMDNLPNGTIGVDTRQVARMRRQLNDTQRQLLLSQQVVRQLEKIHETYEEFKDVTTQLVLNSDAIDAEEETKRIDELKIEIKKLEDRLKLIKRFDNGGPHIDVKPMPVKKIGTNKYRILDREVSINRRASAGDRSSSVELLSNDGESAEDVQSLSRSRQWSGTTVGTENTGLSGRTASIEEELRDINPRRNRSGRQTIIPQRFESFPSAVYRHRRLATGMTHWLTHWLLDPIISSIVRHFVL